MSLRFLPISRIDANAYRSGATDANGNPPVTMISDGQGYPCRCCLNDVQEGKEMLLLSHRPFNTIQAYSETGPIFLCKDDCKSYSNTELLPPNLASRNEFMIRGYDTNEQIVEGSGQFVSNEELSEALKDVLNSENVTFAHVRSGTNTCFQCKVVLEEN